MDACRNNYCQTNNTFSAREKDNDVRCDIEAGMAKLLAARVAWSNADSAFRFTEEMVMHEYPVSRVLCDAKFSIFLRCSRNKLK